MKDVKDKTFLKRVVKVLLWIAATWVVILLILQVILSSSILTGIVNNVAEEYVDGNISFGKVEVSMFRRFPNLSLALDDFSITYPADRFDVEERDGAQGELLYHGTGETADTLASFKRLSASLNVMSLAAGNLNVQHLRLTRPRIFAHNYGNGKANWDLFRFATSEEEEDTTGLSQLPQIALGRISLSGKPHIVYTDSRDTVFAMIDIGRAAFDGRLSTRNDARRQIGLTLDSILVAGRMASDTLAFRLQQMYIHEDDDHMDVGIAANASLLTGKYGRLNLPVMIEGTIGLPKDSIPVVHMTDMQIDIAGVPVELDASIGFGSDKTYIETRAEIPQWEIDFILKDYVSHFIPEVEKIKTDATVSLLAACFGEYDHKTGKLPSISASLSIPESYIRHSDIDLNVLLALEANVYNDDKDRIMIDIANTSVNADGLAFQASGNAIDLIGADPEFGIDGELRTSLDSLMKFIPDSLGIRANGDIAARIKGKARLSQLDIYNFAHSDLLAEFHGDDISIIMPADTVRAHLNGLDISIMPESMSSKRDSSKTYRMLGVKANIENTEIAYKESMMLKGRSIVLSAKNSVNESTDTTARSLGHFGGRFTAENLTFRDAVSTSIELQESTNAFQIIPKRDNPEIPSITLTSENGRIHLSTETNRVILADSKIRAEAAMNSIERKKRMEARLDSLAAIYPGVARDSLLAVSRAERLRNAVVADINDDFKDKDIDIRLDETMAKYFREWDIDGRLDVGLGLIMTPYLPLENYVENLAIGFNNNEVRIENIELEAGESKIDGSGKISGLRRALGGRQGNTAQINVGLDLHSDRINANELMTAYSAGANFNPASLEGADKISDEDFFEQIISDTTVTSTETALLVVPSNIIADVRLNASDITWSDVTIDTVMAKLTAKDRCVQITDTKAQTNIGGLSLDGFYATRSKKDIKAGFDFRFMDITAEKVIDLMPAIDSMIPMLKSFHGMLNCEVAATAQLDTAMNILTPSINGVLRIGGRDLTVDGSDKTFQSVAKMLKFKDLSEGRVDAMTVEGVIKDNTLEVFPFVMQVDRYTMAMSGVQNLDMSFKYHVSMIKSPMLFRFGVDLYGQDFDNLRFKLGKAKYKSAEVPVFSAEIDKTRLNLSKSIRNIFAKGVDNAIAEHQRQEAINEHKKAIGYVEAIDMEMEELSEVQETIIKGE